MKADLILHNGKLHTQDPDYPAATAVAIRANRLLAVGNDAEIRAFADADTRSVDLAGRRVLPGLTDAHFHFRDWALGRRQLALADTPSLASLKEQLAERAKETPPGDWIQGQGWNETRWPEQRMPTRRDLDAAASDPPVILWRSDLHLAVANSRALEEAGITAQTSNPEQGVIDRDSAGEPTGILRELAIGLVRDVIPAPTEEETVDALRAALPALHALGLTGVHDHRIMGGADGQPSFRACQRLQAADDLTLRLWMDLPGERLDEAIALGLRSGMGGDRLRVGHLKLFSDGGQGARTAWMLEPYEDTGECGMPLTPMDVISEKAHQAHRAGLAVAVHAIGDRANRELIGVFERVLRAEREAETAPPAARHRIEHAQNLRPADVERLAQLDIVASVQPIHATDDIPMTEASVGERARFAYPFRDMWDAGVTLALGSDAPVASPNPFWGLHAAVTRQRRDGTPEGGWYPRQRLTVSEAVWGFTMGPALVSGREAELGSITPGKLADLVVLDRDIFAIPPGDIAETAVTMTVFDGQVVYER